MIVVLSVISAGFVALALGLTIVRILFERRFTEIQKEPDQTPIFRRKVNHLRRIEQARHIRYLLFTCLMIVFGIMFVIGSFLVLVDDQQNLKTQNMEMKERISQLEKQQTTLIASIPLKNYPKEGIGLNKYEWDKLATETKDSDLQKQIEATISQTTLPYFGSMDTTVSLAVPKTLSLQLNGQTDDDISKKMVQKNIDAFAKEAEAIYELTDIHVRMVIAVGKEKNIIYNVNYSRENGESDFNKKNVSEKNLKNDGGKG